MWYNIFKTFDRDGGGDVDLRELGLMFRQLGQHPSEREMRLLIEEVDADQSGTIDFEEFCCLMLRQARAAVTPAWLCELLWTGTGSEDAHPNQLPASVVLSDPKFEAAKVIKKRLKAGKLGGGSKVAVPVSSHTDDEELTREHLLITVDLLPSAAHVTHAAIAGHGHKFGPFIAGELSWRLATSTRTSVTSLDLSFDAIGDDGAQALAKALRTNKHIVTLDLSGNDIGQRGASALMAVICMAQEGGRRPPLRTLNLDENRLSQQMMASIQTQLLQNNIGTVISEATRPAEKGKAVLVSLSLTAAGSGNADAASEASEGMELGERPACRMTDEWLGPSHLLPMRERLVQGGIKSLHLHKCERFTDAALATLIAPTPPTPAGVPMPPRTLQLTRLRVSSCGIADGVADAIAIAVRDGNVLANLRGLALDDNSIALGAVAVPTAGSAAPPVAGDGATLATRLGAALRRLPKLEQLDLSHNILLRDTAAVEMCAALLAAKPTDGTSTPSALKLLHLGGTGAGNSTAVACADALGSPACLLSVLCISGDVGDVGARALATALSKGGALRELYLGNKISDMGVEGLCAAIGEKGGACRLEVLCLGGLVRGDVLLSNRLETRSGALLAETLRTNPDGPLQQLRLSGNATLGGTACLGIIGSLATCSKLRALHVEGCGLTKPEVAPLVEAMHEVWCLHELIVDRTIPEAKTAAAARANPQAQAPAGTEGPQKKVKQPKLLGLQHRISLSKVLEDNKVMGQRRVESWRLSRSLEEVAWVFTTFCAGITKEIVDAGLAAWDGSACGQFVHNLGLPQYAETFAFNLTGRVLGALRMSDLSQMGVSTYSEQKLIMTSVRSLLAGYERRERVAKANQLWVDLLKGGASAMKQSQQDEQERVMLERGEPPPAPLAPPATAPAAPSAAVKARVTPAGEPEPHGGVHTYQRALSPGRSGKGSADSMRARRPRGQRQPRAEWSEKPLPIIEQPPSVHSVAQWPKRSISRSSAAYMSAEANAAPARQANFSVAGSQLRSETRELFRGLMRTLETQPPEYEYSGAPGSATPSRGASRGSGGVLPTAAQQFNAANSRRLGGSAAQQRLEASFGSMPSGHNAPADNSHALYGACEGVIALRHCGPGASASVPAAAYDIADAPSHAASPYSSSHKGTSRQTMDASLPGLSMSRSSGALRKAQFQPGATPGGGLTSSSSLSEFPGVRKAQTTTVPGRWAPPASHGHPRVGVVSPMLLTTWSEAADNGKDSAPHKLTSKERMLQKAEAALNERLASAAASLQSFKMATLDVYEGSPGSTSGVIARSVPKRHMSSSLKSIDGVDSAAAAERRLRLDGQQVPSSNERLGLILSDLMR